MRTIDQLDIPLWIYNQLRNAGVETIGAIRKLPDSWFINSGYFHRGVKGRAEMRQIREAIEKWQSLRPSKAGIRAIQKAVKRNERDAQTKRSKYPGIFGGDNA